MSADSVLLERVDDAVLVITLNRPEVRNAFDNAMSRRLSAALDELEHDPALRVGILTGTGAAFSAGQDLKALAAGEPSVPDDLAQHSFAGFVRHYVSKPMIAAVNGFAFGGGFELTLACDLAIASTTATFALPEVRRGLFAAAGGVPRVVQQLPAKIGMRLLLTGDPIDAAEAARWGLVNEVVAPEQLLPASLDLARAVLRNAPLGLAATKRIAAQAAQSSTWDPQPWGLIAEQFDRVFGSEDAAEGAVAFVEKRDPVWRGR